MCKNVMETTIHTLAKRNTGSLTYCLLFERKN